MANWYGAARSNYVKIKDMGGLKASLEPFPINISAHKSENPSLVCFLSEEMDSGGWPSFATIDVGNDEEYKEEEIEFDPLTQICPFMEDDQILVMMQSGAEKLRYISGDAQAYNSKGEYIYIDLTNIYQLAATTWNVPISSITLAEY